MNSVDVKGNSFFISRSESDVFDETVVELPVVRWIATIKIDVENVIYFHAAYSVIGVFIPTCPLQDTAMN